MSTPLRERTINTLRVGHYAERTIETYIGWLTRLAEHYHRSPAELSSDQVQAYLLHLTEKDHLAYSTVNLYCLNWNRTKPSFEIEINQWRKICPKEDSSVLKKKRRS